MMGMISVRPEYFANVPTRECRPELVRLEKLVPELNWRRTELIALLPIAPAAQTGGVVSREHCSAALAETTATGRTAQCRSLRTGRAHDLRQVEADLAFDQRTWGALSRATNACNRESWSPVHTVRQTHQVPGTCMGTGDLVDLASCRYGASALPPSATRRSRSARAAARVACGRSSKLFHRAAVSPSSRQHAHHFRPPYRQPRHGRSSPTHPTHRPSNTTR
jgi:hypothetical protein